MRRGMAAGLSAFSLDRVNVWNLEELKKRHALLVQGLADRWGFGKEWKAVMNAHDDNDNNDDADRGKFVICVALQHQ